jgi:hypothetical protein
MLLWTYTSLGFPECDGHVLMSQIETRCGYHDDAAAPAVIVYSARSPTTIANALRIDDRIAERLGRPDRAAYITLDTSGAERNSGWPTGREPYGHGVSVVVVGATPHLGERESRLQGEGTGVKDRQER